MVMGKVKVKIKVKVKVMVMVLDNSDKMVMVLDTQIRFYENLVKITHAGLQNKVFFRR